MSLLTSRPSEWPGCDLEILPDRRQRLIVREDVAAIRVNNNTLTTWGTAPDKSLVGLYSESADLRLIGLTFASREGAHYRIRTYEELHATNETQVGLLDITTGPDGRKTATAQFLQFSAATATPGTPGTTTAPGDATLILDREVALNDGALRRITRYYIQATSTVTKVGDTHVSIPDKRAFTGTSSGAVVSTTKFARQFTLRYIVAGDGTAAVNWHAVNSVLVIAGVNTYMTDTYLVYRGIAHTTLERVYNELPDSLVREQTGQYTFEGQLGYSSSLGPYVTEPGTTRQTVFEIEETYQVGELAASILEFEVYRRAGGVVSYTRSTGEEGAQAFALDGIGQVTVSMTNKIFAGYLCSTVTGTVESDHYVSGGGQAFPDYPTGKKRISSRSVPWFGDIWKRTNVYVTFP